MDLPQAKLWQREGCGEEQQPQIFCPWSLRASLKPYNSKPYKTSGIWKLVGNAGSRAHTVEAEPAFRQGPRQSIVTLTSEQLWDRHPTLRGKTWSSQNCPSLSELGKLRGTLSPTATAVKSARLLHRFAKGRLGRN